MRDDDIDPIVPEIKKQTMFAMPALQLSQALEQIKSQGGALEDFALVVPTDDISRKWYIMPKKDLPQ